MKKSLIILILSLLLLGTAKAQQDTVLYYMKNSGVAVANKDSADYLLRIMPADSSTGKVLYPVIEYYLSGKLKFTGNSKTKDYSDLQLQGATVAYYPNGQRKRLSTYAGYYRVGESTEFYPNGKVYAIRKYFFDKTKNSQAYVTRLVECRDSTGKILAANGSGQWVDYDDDFKYVNGEGNITDSLANGQWKGAFKDSSRYECSYVNGEGLAGVRYDKDGTTHPFDKAEVEPSYKGGVQDFYAFLGHIIKYPKVDKENNVQGKVIVIFVVDADGTISHTEAVRAPDALLSNEAIRAILASSPWKPGQQFGRPVRAQYTETINFTLGNK